MSMIYILPVTSIHIEVQSYQKASMSSVNFETLYFPVHTNHLFPLYPHFPLMFFNKCRFKDGMCLSMKINIFKKKVPTGKAVTRKDSAVLIIYTYMLLLFSTMLSLVILERETWKIRVGFLIFTKRISTADKTPTNQDNKICHDVIDVNKYLKYNVRMFDEIQTE